jgi:hypothetical protein
MRLQAVLALSHVFLDINIFVNPMLLLEMPCNMLAPVSCFDLQVLRKQITAEQPRHETQQQIDAVNRDIDNIRADIRRQQLTYEV